MVATMANAQEVTLRHQKGMSGRALQANGMQATSEVDQVVYMKTGEQKALQMPIVSYGATPSSSNGNRTTYNRFYNYDTDKKVASGLTFTGSVVYPFGHTLLNTKPTANAIYTFDGTPIKIGYDASMYNDYSENATITGYHFETTGVTTSVPENVSMGTPVPTSLTVGSTTYSNITNTIRIDNASRDVYYLTAGSNVSFYAYVPVNKTVIDTMYHRYELTAVWNNKKTSIRSFTVARSYQEVASISGTKRNTTPTTVSVTEGTNKQTCDVYELGGKYYAYYMVTSSRTVLASYTRYTLKIVADMSGDVTSITEPTLSYRVIYDIRPASEIADQINKTNYFETYEITAPAGNAIHLQLGNTVDNYYFNTTTTTTTTTTTYTADRYVSRSYTAPNTDNKVSGAKVHISATPVSGVTFNGDYDVYLESGNYYAYPYYNYRYYRFSVTAKTTTNSTSNTDLTNLKTDGVRLYKNGASATVNLLGGRVLNVGSLTVGKHTFEVKSASGYLIAKYVVTVVDKEQTGPKLGDVISDQEMHKRFDLAAEPINFDHPQAGQFWNTPGAFDQIDYGFRYPTNRTVNSTSYSWGEYALLNRSNLGTGVNWLHDVKNYANQSDVSPVDGYYMAIDAAEMPGVVADLVFTGNLCPGSEIYFSARVVNMSNQTTKATPNLNFIVYGKNGKEEKYMKTFTTGDFGSGSDAGEWMHVFFTLHLDVNKYQEYRLKIVNNGGSAEGNDFGIDDIRIYKAEPRSKAFQAIMACGTDEDHVIAVLRNDYLGEGYQNQSIWGDDHMATFFYQWQEENGTVIDLDYLDGDNSTNDVVAINNGHDYGQMELDRNILTKEALIAKYGYNHYYESLREYMSEARNLEKSVDFFFTHETVNAIGDDDQLVDEVRPILYITNKSAVFQMFKTYNSITSIAQPNFVGSCSSTCTFTVQPRTQLVVDGVAQNGYKVSSICANQTYELSVKVWDDDEAGTEIRTAGCRSDWFEGDTTGIGNALTNAFWNLRKEYKTGDCEQAVKGAYSQADKDLLQYYDGKGQIQWNMGAINMAPNKDATSTFFVIYPIAGSGTINGKADETIEVCNAPVMVELKPQSAIEFGSTEDIKPDAMPDKTATVRITEYQAKHGFNLPVFETWNNAEIETMKIISSTDGDITSSDNYMLNVAEHNTSPVRGDEIAITPASISPKYMKPGVKYVVFVQLKKRVSTGCEVPAAYYNVIVVPDVVVWTPSTDNRAWNNDANWKMENGHDAFVPLPTTNVIIPARSVSPSLPTEAEKHATEPGATPYITYDINYAKSNCHNIYFAPDAMIQNQHVLNYDSAYVDMEIKTSCWNMITVPLKEVYSGDFYIPSNHAETAPLVKNTTCDGRTDNMFYISLFNQASQDMTMAGYTVTKQSDRWTPAVNRLDMEYTPITAVAVRYSGTAQTGDYVTLKLPKEDKEYYYYRQKDSTQTDYSVSLNRTVDSHKFAFEPNQPDGKTMRVQFDVLNKSHIFFIGNPMMASLDLSKFYAANKNVIANTFWVGDGNTEEIPPLEIDEYIGNTGFTGNAVDYVKPLHGFFVMLKDTTNKVNSLTLDFSADMANITSFDKINAAAPSRRNMNKLEEDEVPMYFLDEMEDVLMIEATQRFSNYKEILSRCAIVGNGMFGDKLAIALDKSSYVYATDESSKAYTVKNVGYDVNVPIAFSYPEDYTKIGDVFTIHNSFNRDDLYLYDSKADTYKKINYGENTFFLKTTNADVVRYYIRSYAPGVATGTEFVEDNITNIYAVGNQVRIEAADVIGHVEVYNVLGQLVNKFDVQNNDCAFTLMTGAYVVKTNGAVEQVIVK